MQKLGEVRMVEDISDEYLKLATNDERVAVQLAVATEKNTLKDLFFRNSLRQKYSMCKIGYKRQLEILKH
ncbi:MAG: hypothetical protein ABS948_17000 [Solibacillus sp.]